MKEGVRCWNYLTAYYYLQARLIISDMLLNYDCRFLLHWPIWHSDISDTSLLYLRSVHLSITFPYIHTLFNIMLWNLPLLLFIRISLHVPTAGLTIVERRIANTFTRDRYSYPSTTSLRWLNYCTVDTGYRDNSVPSNLYTCWSRTLCNEHTNKINVVKTCTGR